ncbi:TetR/AcrR family transcriptional regulator [Roseobacter weihaiensis]|uniref:TetR/AcrR family transcriptional regulator n=1 Tax=Roseobacter weihaiensis TaxID=2763262 RepID=UPI001D09F2CD|nr:TetR/AcrR family transcriptional regulator [Roseobacter sp. H9]
MSDIPADTPRRGRGRPRIIDRQAALDAAVRLFWERGYDGASLTDLTGAMGLSRPSLYAAFGDKDALFLRALGRYGETIGADPMVAFERAIDIQTATRAFLETSLRSNTAPDMPPGCLFACCAGTVATQDTRVASFLSQVMEGTAARLTNRFAAATSNGLLTACPTPATRATLTIDMMNAQAIRARAGATREDLMADLDARVDAVLLVKEVTSVSKPR